MTSKNLKLWESVQQTPPEFVTKDTSKTPHRSSVKAMFQKRRATETFGANGLGWGIIPASEKYERYTIGDTHLLQFTATMFYMLDNNRGEMPIAACVKEAYITNGGKGYLKVDEEAIKKVRTDALTKGLSELGFSSDIYMGMYDDQNYIAHAYEVSAEKNAEKLEKQTIDEAEEYSEWKAKSLEYYSSLSTVRAIKAAFTGHARKAEKIGDKKGIKEFDEAAKARIEELKGDKK